MALAKKYAGLPDLADSQEIYETPALTDDTSTTQTDTLRTESPTPSDESGDERVIRERIDQNNARKRFEPTLVSARDVNFSDTVAVGERRSYSTKSRRRRKGIYGDSDDESDTETLNEKVSRLKREAEEVRLALANKEVQKPDAEGQPAKPGSRAAEAQDLGVEELRSLINGLSQSTQTSSPGQREDALLNSLSKATVRITDGDSSAAKPDSQRQAPSASALASVADRLTAIETALGLPSISTSPQSILPSLDVLSTQLTTLTSTLVPTNRGSATRSVSSTNPNLDDLQSRIRQLTMDADKLTASRKAAMTSLADLHEARLRYSQQARHTHGATSASRDNRLTQQQSGTASDAPAAQLDQKEAAVHADIFLSEQASKITALYQLLPSITELQPLLPVVLDRLRSLSVIHAGAAEARGELDDVLRRQGEARTEIKRWREAVEETEKKIEEMKEEMGENVKVVGGMVKGVEDKVKMLGKE